MNLDRRLRQASTEVRHAVAGRQGAPITFMARYGNVMRFAAAATVAVVVTVAVGILALDGGRGPKPLSVAGQLSVTTTTVPPPTTTTLTQQTTTSEGLGAVHSAVEVDVNNAVAPFDHESNVDSHILGRLVGNYGADWQQYVSDCMAEQGFDEPEWPVAPSRDDPMLISNWQFPPVDAFAADGFPVLPGTPSSPEDFVEQPERSAASLSCEASAGERFLTTDDARASELYRTIRSAWEEVLTEMDDSDEIGALVGGFGSCLVDEGIPVEYTTSVERYLGYVDSLLVDSDDDATKIAEIHKEYGKLYAECGRELFETREQLRSGEQRVAFLEEHAEAIRELTDLINSQG